MPKKPRLTLDGHLEMGRVLAGIRDELAHRAVQLDKAYPSSGPESIPHKKVGAALRTLDEARSDLEGLLSREHPDAAETTVYYPYPEDRSVVIAPDRPAS
ncbi:hypothetical protein [Streptomyces sp. MI02-7b]|uniref:hypothetical protein n=1 Tax=Streptomyces sp. MI02-7b TaxID=462941 RepID=UPI0029AE0380|nr:hypothetical protein [Streptomyces sp. MI02-7b]MDX3078522.1 hypothetical protein [Streptomyces sp. MI02-7b]